MQNSNKAKKKLRIFLKMHLQKLPAPEINAKWPAGVRDAVPYIYRHLYNDKLKVAKLKEDLFGCNGNNFSTDFTYYIGTPPSTYINDLRIEMAKRVFSEKRFLDIGILTIARELGFSGKGNFHHTFREREGISPAQWRKKMLRE